MSRKLNSKGLTARQQAFCHEYLKDLNAGKAAIRSGFSKKGCRVVGCRMLDMPAVTSYIQEIMDKRAKRVDVDADWVLQKLIQIADLDPKDLYDEGLKLKPLKDMPPEIRKVIAELVPETSSDTSFNPARVKTLDKLKALELLGRHLKMFTDKVEHSGDISIAHLIAKARARAKAGKKE